MPTKCPLCGENELKQFKDEKELGKHVASAHTKDLLRNPLLFESLLCITNNPINFIEELTKILNPVNDKPLIDTLKKLKRILLKL